MIKLMGIVSEGNTPVNSKHANPEVFAISKKIAKLTDKNDHTTAVIELAKFLKDTKSIKKLEAIEVIHKVEGSIPLEISKYRDNILKGLFKKIMNDDSYSLTDIANLKGAF
jgi:hypothetical protein